MGTRSASMNHFPTAKFYCLWEIFTQFSRTGQLVDIMKIINKGSYCSYTQRPFSSCLRRHQTNTFICQSTYFSGFGNPLPLGVDNNRRGLQTENHGVPARNGNKKERTPDSGGNFRNNEKIFEISDYRSGVPVGDWTFALSKWKTPHIFTCPRHPAPTGIQFGMRRDKISAQHRLPLGWISSNRHDLRPVATEGAWRYHCPTPRNHSLGI